VTFCPLKRSQANKDETRTVKNTRVEHDSLGPVEVPADALYGAQTQRAVENFPISDRRFSRPFIAALGLIKSAMARANAENGRLDAAVAEAIRRAADEVREGRWDDQFVVDVFQTGSGTSTNMNANEVIATRATEILTGGRAGPPRIHPNDHVNRGQSSNDVIPTAIHVAAATELVDRLLPSLAALRKTFARKAAAFRKIVKIGRTHLQDATPITLGQEFSGYAAQLREAEKRIRAALPGLYELPLGGTAVGTGLNTTPSVTERAIQIISEETGLPFREASNHFEAQAARDAVVFASAALRNLVVALTKIANDIRWLGSGPRCGLGELLLPATQPGSSIMPGKVNPVQAEALLMVCTRVIGHDASIAWAGASGAFELNVMMPVMADSLLDSIALLSNAMDAFRERCVSGIRVNRERLRRLIDQSLALVTALVPRIGYDRAAEIAKEAWRTGKTVKELVVASGLLSEEEAERVLDPMRMTAAPPDDADSA